MSSEINKKEAATAYETQDGNKAPLFQGGKRLGLGG